jgi:hypothetical protein
MGGVLRAVAAGLALLALFVAGTATASPALRKVVLKPGRCISVAKLRVCAPKAKPPVTRTVTDTVTSTVQETVTSPPVTVTAPPETVTTTVSTPPPPPATAFTDGTYRVGTDIQAGTYQSTATTPDACYWARLSGFGGTLDEIIGNYSGSSPTIVTIEPSDAGFSSSDCGGWAKIG